MRSGIKKTKKIQNKNEVFTPDEIVDIINEKENETYEGKIIAIKGDLIVVQNLNKKKVENYSINENKILKLWKPNRTLQKYNRVDLELNNTNYWVEAIVLDINELKNQFLIKYKNSNRFKKACEEWIDFDSGRISPIGSYTKYENQNNNPNNLSITTTSLKLPLNESSNIINLLSKKTLNSSYSNISSFCNNSNISLSQEQELKFKNLMKRNNFEIREVSGDGNCLFRAISDQIYGTDKYYEIIREKCMDYLEVQKKFFQFFVEGNFDEYIKEKRKSGVWGDDIELEALSEIYNRPIEIYSGTTVPLKCFHEDTKKFLYKEGTVTAPIRLSYHGSKHYNSVIPLHNDDFKYKLYENSLINGKPGAYEKKIIALAKDNEERLNRGIKISETEYMNKLKKNLAGQKKEEILDKIILTLNKTDSKDNKELITDNKNKKLKVDDNKDIIEEKNNIKENVENNNKVKKEEIQKDNNQVTIDEKNSLKENAETNNDKKKEKEEKKQVESDKKIENKREDLTFDDIYLSNPVVQSALELGFNINEIIEAINVCGDDDEEILINYLINSKE